MCSGRCLPLHRLAYSAIDSWKEHGCRSSWWNHLLRRRYPEHGRMHSRARTASLLQSTYVQERFHWTVLLFFLLTSFCRESQNNRIKTGVRAFFHVDFFIFSFFS